MTKFKVAVYGASGHTGRFVAAELERRDVTVKRVVRRSPNELNGHKGEAQSTWVVASCDEPEALDHAFAGAQAVINCAGPFLDTAPAVIEATLRAGAHYLDIAAEQRSVRQSLATYHTEALDRGVVVLPAMAFYGGLADLLVAQLCAGLSAVDEILIGVGLDYWHPTVGTRRSGDRNTARRLIVSSGVLTPLPVRAARGDWQFPPPFGTLSVTCVPLSEIITISRHIAANRIESFMNEAPLKDLGGLETPPPTSADEHGRSTQTFVMDVFASGQGQSRRLAAFGRDIYAVSAPLVVEACLRLLSQSPRKGGAFAPAELFDPQDYLAALSPHIRLESMSQSNPMEFL